MVSVQCYFFRTNFPFPLHNFPIGFILLIAPTINSRKMNRKKSVRDKNISKKVQKTQLHKTLQKPTWKHVFKKATCKYIKHNVTVDYSRACFKK